MYKATTTNTITDEAGNETLYTFTSYGLTEDEAVAAVVVYASMVEYGLVAERWQPGEMAFPREQLYQFIQPSQLSVLESMYPDCVATAYQNAVAYIQSYIGNMFDVEAILTTNEMTSTAYTLRLALLMQTAIFVLASSPQYAETTEMHNKQLHMLLRGLKAGSRNFGADATIAEPNARVQIVTLTKTGQKP